MSANPKHSSIALRSQARQLFLYHLQRHCREHRELIRELTASGVKMAAPHENGQIKVRAESSAVALKRDGKRTTGNDDQHVRQDGDGPAAGGDRGDHGGEPGAEKKDLRLEDLSRVPAESKAAVMQIVAHTKRRSGWPAHRTLAALGVPRSVYYAWKRRESLHDRPCA